MVGKPADFVLMLHQEFMRAFVRKIALLAIFAGRKSLKQDRNLPAIIRTGIFRKWTIEQDRGFLTSEVDSKLICQRQNGGRLGICLTIRTLLTQNDAVHIEAQSPCDYCMG